MTSYKVVKARIKAELDNISKLHKELADRGMLETSEIRKGKLEDQFTLRAVGSIFHDFYTSVENMFKSIARYIDSSIPDSDEWHVELLQQMTVEIDGIRPVVITERTLKLLNEIRAFRHVFRNVYGFNLISERVEQQLAQFDQITDSINKDMLEFLDRMDNIVNN